MMKEEGFKRCIIYDDDYDDDGGDGDYARYNQQLSDFNVQ